MPAQLSDGITVADIVGIAHLRLRLLAGAAGLERRVSWAHVFDNPNPWDWLDPTVLVMTSGWIVPAGPAAQVTFVERMADAGLSGLIVGDDPHLPAMHVPVLTSAMIEAADRVGLPLIAAHRHTSWIEISQLVARANQAREGRTLNLVMRVHECVRGWLANPGASSDLLEALGRVVGARLYLVDARSWEPLLPSIERPDDAWQQALARALAARGEAVPLMQRLHVEGQVGTAVAVPVPTERPDAFLIVDVPKGDRPRIAVLQHVAAACALESARIESMWREDWWSGSALFAEALQGRVASATLAANLEERRLTPPYVCVAVDAPFEEVDRLDRFWLVRRVPHLLTRTTSAHFLLTADDARLDELRAFCEREGVRAGASEPFAAVTALPDASQQARWALETVPAGTGGVASYGAGGHTFLPRTLLESRHVVERILGPLIAYDAEHGSDLIATLRTYLECDRSPRQAAALLHVHHQTVNYRVSRIQELTGRSLRSTADLTELWFALRALAVTGE